MTAPDAERHVVPRGDLIQHETSDKCVCVPAPKFVTGGVVYVHHSLDNRESKEQK